MVRSYIFRYIINNFVLKKIKKNWSCKLNWYWIDTKLNIGFVSAQTQTYNCRCWWCRSGCRAGTSAASWDTRAAVSAADWTGRGRRDECARVGWAPWSCGTWRLWRCGRRRPASRPCWPGRSGVWCLPRASTTSWRTWGAGRTTPCGSSSRSCTPAH